MPCIPIKNGFVCCSAGPYEYKGILFELHSYLGPHPIRKKDFEPWKTVPKKVWGIASKFMSEKDKNKFLFPLPYAGVDEHPENYDGPCGCDLCMSYA